MTASFRRPAMNLKVLLFATFALLALPSYASAQTASPCKGTWNGTVGPGSGTVSVLGSNQQIATNSIVTGTFTGDTTHGTLTGTMVTTYTVPGMGQKGQVTGTLTGTYVMSIALNGTITGTATIPLTGQFGGQFKFTIHGQESQSQLTGTWTGTLTVTQVTYMGMPLGANIVAPGSGQFTGTVQT